MTCFTLWCGPEYVVIRTCFVSGYDEYVFSVYHIYIKKGLHQS